MAMRERPEPKNLPCIFTALPPLNHLFYIMDACECKDCAQTPHAYPVYDHILESTKENESKRCTYLDAYERKCRRHES